jgi:Tol biopolymer transport system component
MKFLFSGIGQGEYYYDMEIYTLDLSTGLAVQLTDNDEWDEHAHFTSDGRWIVWVSSEDIPQTRASTPQETVRNPPRLDFWIMNPDGSDKRRVTGFNDPDAAEFISVRVGVGLGDFDIGPDGKRMIVKLRRGRTDTVVLVELEIP